MKKVISILPAKGITGCVINQSVTFVILFINGLIVNFHEVKIVVCTALHLPIFHSVLQELNLTNMKKITSLFIGSFVYSFFTKGCYQILSRASMAKPVPADMLFDHGSLVNGPSVNCNGTMILIETR